MSTENNHLDLNALRVNDPYWWEDIDLSCPFCEDGKVKAVCSKCQGEGEYPCPNHEGNEAEAKGCDDPHCENGVIGCDECERGLGYVITDESCQECSDGYFEIMWDVAFRIPYLKRNLNFEGARKLAFKRGWLLFEYDDELWIAAGSCGYDFTWVKAACALEICGDLPDYYAEQLTRGGEVFVHDETEKIALCKAAAESFGWQIKRLQSGIQDFEKLAKQTEFDQKMKAEASHAKKVEEKR